jgi:steroid delta-isomerase-like uncharacterized protein
MFSIRLTILAVTTFLFLNSCGRTVEETAGEQGDSTETRQIYGRLLEFWSTGDSAGLEEVVTEDFVYVDFAGEQSTGREAFRDLVMTNRAAVPDLRFELVEFFETGGLAAAEWIMKGTDTVDSPDGPATGKTFSVRGASVMRFRDGMISRNHVYYDLYGFLQQFEVVEEE